jgi:ssDNA-binding Zn-finger/Zn-ribbon topoisomerase 1
MEETVRVRFNQILQSHYERLMGTIHVPGGLPLSLDNIGCLILFGGRELEVTDFTSEISERYTMEAFLKEIQDLGIETDEHFQTAMQDLMQKKYIEQLPDGHIHGYSDTKETAGILNRIFPQMQGLNLLAYIWQTIAEVTSGRTDLESALSRFDQTLNNHGVIPPKPKIPVIKKDPEKPAAPEKKEPEISHRSDRIIRDYVVSQTVARPIPSAPEPVGPPPASPVKTDRDAVISEKERWSSAVRKDTEEKRGITVSEIDQKIQAETEAMKQKIAELEKAIATGKEKQAPAAEVIRPEKKEEVDGVVEAVDPRDRVAVDDEVAKQIAAFEKELALSCPICKTGVLQEKSTTAGKLFYACATKNCNFISWGKPHHIHCVRCKNPFLIEATDAAGQTVLRCPRATCQHRQALNAGSGVRVVRKRIVRRPR